MSTILWVLGGFLVGVVLTWVVVMYVASKICSPFLDGLRKRFLNGMGG